MSQEYKSGDFLIFQVESGYGLLRLLLIEEIDSELVWHLAAYREMFLDIDIADQALLSSQSLTVTHPHLVLTTRAFESTQTARMKNVPLKESELTGMRTWQNDPARDVSDRSVRLLLGLR